MTKLPHPLKRIQLVLNRISWNSINDWRQPISFFTIAIQLCCCYYRSTGIQIQSKHYSYFISNCSATCFDPLHGTSLGLVLKPHVEDKKCVLRYALGLWYFIIYTLYIYAEVCLKYYYCSYYRVYNFICCNYFNILKQTSKFTTVNSETS
jgi:hypothetical protein